MGRKSTKTNKSRYQITRENANMTRANVADITDNVISESKLEKIENGTQRVDPYDVVKLAEIYNNPELCNYYCTNECAIGAKFVPKVDNIHDLPRTTLQILSSLNQLQRDKETIIDIVSDGVVTEDEKGAFDEFRSHLDEMSLAIETLKLWVEKELS